MTPKHTGNKCLHKESDTSSVNKPTSVGIKLVHSKRLAPYETKKKHRTSTVQAPYMTVN